MVEHGRATALDSLFVLDQIVGYPPLPDASQLCPELVGIADRVVGAARQPERDHVLDSFRLTVGHDDLAEARRVQRVCPANSRIHSHGARALDLLDVDDLVPVLHPQMTGFTRGLGELFEWP